MNICLLNESFPPVIDGVANVVLNYARILQKMPGTRVLVGTPRYPDTDYTVYPYPVVAYQSIATGEAASGYRAGNPFDQNAAKQLIDFRPDIIHAHSPASSVFMARVLRYVTEAPIVYTYHTKYDIDIARAVKSELLQKETIKALVENVSACDEVWAVSRGAGENLRSLGYQGKYHVMTNGVDFPKGRVPDKDVRKAVKGFDLPDGVPMFLFVGRLMNYKGLPMIIDALRMLSDTGRDFRMVFVGNGPDAELLQKQALDCDFAVDIRKSGKEASGNEAVTAEEEIEHLNSETMRKGKIIFAGSVRERNVLRAWNTRADLFLFPSTFDTNGLVVREAAACGLASVLIKDSCAAEGIEDGRNGFIIPEKASALAALLGELCRHPEKAKEAGEKAMQEIYISWESCVKEAHERYAVLLGRKKLGILPSRKRDATEYFLRMAGEVTLTSYDAFNTRREIREGMMENAIELRDSLQGAWVNALGFKETVQERRKQMMKTVETFMEDARSDIEKLRDDALRGFREVRDDVEKEFEDWKKY
ncbi:MAG: glycosyltransferase family 4 protein [Lachnospiraceae bacterium]|nr:glycosyltransferase family 4 protein [Lachnospiraceae bacterium]